jgi:hypothetical protein
MTCPDTRLIECPNCNGDCGWEILTGYNARNGEPTGYWQACDYCEARGEIEIEVEPIEMADLDFEVARP